jgi:Flp pilus assembly protein TadG
MPHARLRNAAAALRSDEHGGLAVTFALVLIGLVVAVGMAVDYAMAMRDRSTLQNTADAAALAASRSASEYLAANGWSSTNAATAQTDAVAVAQKTFAANIAGGVFTGTPSITTTMSIPSATDVTA